MREEEQAMKPSVGDRKKTVRDCLVLGCTCLLIYFHGLGRMQLKREEPRQALVAREMLATGEWIVPTISGQPYPAEPPLPSWLIALSAAPTGRVTETTARLPSALSVVAIVFLIYWTGRTFLGRRAAFLSGLIVATTSLFIERGVLAEVDVLFALWMTAAVLFLFRALHKKPSSGLDWLLAYASLALACLTKGPPALVFFFGTMLALIWLDKDRASLRTRQHLLGLGVFLAIAAAWVVAVSYQVGPKLFFQSMHGQVVRGIASDSVLRHLASLFYCPAHVLAGFLPWTPLLLLALGSLRRYPLGPPRKHLVRFVVIYAAASLVLGSLCAGRPAGYILPLFPALALLAGDVCDRLLSRELAPRLARIGRWCLVATHAALTVAVTVVAVWCVWQWYVPLAHVAFFSALGLIASLAGYPCAHRKKYGASFAAIVAVVCVYRVAYVTTYVPDYNARESIKHVTGPLKDAMPEDAKLYTVSLGQTMVFFYLDRPAIAFKSVSELAAGLSSAENAYCLLTKAERRKLISLQPGVWRQALTFRYRDKRTGLFSKGNLSSRHLGAPSHHRP